MPQPLPAVTAALSVLSIQRVAPAIPAASTTQPMHQALSLRTLGNRPHPQTWEPSADAARTTPQQASQCRSGYVRVVPSELVRAQRGGVGATPTHVAVDATSSPTLTAQEHAVLKACSWQLRAGWRDFQDALVAHAVSDLDASWPPSARRVFELSAHQLLLDKPPSELLAQPVFAEYLGRPGCLQLLLPAAMKWLEAHTAVLERWDIERTGASDVSTGKHAYLAEMATLLGGRYDQALGNATLLKIFNALHEEGPALREREAMYRASGPHWEAWMQGLSQGAP